MLDLLSHLSIVLLPLVITGSLHMIAVKSNFLSHFNRPIWEYGFGINKTWRGFLFVPIVNAIIVFIIDLFFNNVLLNSFLLGYILGMAYVVAELPNSFLKRRLGIGAGLSSNRFKYLFYLIDKTDSSFGVTICYVFLKNVNPNLAFLIFICNTIAHVLVSFLLLQLRIKRGF